MSDRSLWDVVGLLWPDWGQLFRGELGGINALIIGLIIVITICFVVYLARKTQEIRQRVDDVTELVSGLHTDELVATREDIRSRALESKSLQVRHLWREFDETLVESPDGRTLWNTLDAEHFFNTHSLAREIVHNRVLSVVPSVLTAIGVLGTFIGLTTGLNGLDLQTESSVDELKAGIDTLITGAAIAFMTSVWGVLASLVTNVVEKFVERSLTAKISEVQELIDHLYRRHAPEQSLVKIMGSTSESATSLQELHERIGNQLQEAVEGLSSDLQVALIEAIDSAMKPAMSSLVESTSEQSTEVFEKLVGQFSEGFQKIGTQQADMLNEASANMTTAVESVSSGFTSMMTSMHEEAAAQREAVGASTALFQDQMAQLLTLSAQQREYLETVVGKLLAEIEAAGEKIADSGENLADASRELRVVSETLGSASTTLGGQFESAASKLDTITEQQQNASQLFWDYSQKLTELERALGQTATQMNQAAAASNEGFTKLEKSQQVFLDGLHERVEKLASSMRAWLDEYSSEVTVQIGERMDVWNKHSQDYASHMLRTANALSEAVDELEARR